MTEELGPLASLEGIWESDKIKAQDELFHHTDENTLPRIA